MTNAGDIHVVPLDEWHYARAQRLCDQTEPYAGSHRGEAALQVGFLGEIVARDFLDEAAIQYDPVFSTSHDLALNECGRVEIKTKDRTVQPQAHYDCSVPLYNHEHQDVNYYIFVSLLRVGHSDDIARFTKAYLVGACNQRMLNEHAKDWQAGDTDPDNGTTFWTACRNIAIKNLLPIHYAAQRWRDRQRFLELP